MSVLRVGSALGLAVALATSAAHAAGRAPSNEQRERDHRQDGVYGRFNGDLELSFGLGEELGSAGKPAALARGAAYYYSSVGLYLLGRLPVADESARTLLEAGVEAKPLFLIRWQNALELGPAFWDLTLDSCSLTLGTFWASPRGRSFGDEHGFDAGFGFGLPLLARANGPWLETRGTLRYPSRMPHESAAYLLLSWHGFLLTPMLGD